MGRRDQGLALRAHGADLRGTLRVYTRRRFGIDAPTVGGWWGESLPRFKDRSQEEIDIVGLKHKRLQLVGECKWTNSLMPLSVLEDLRTYKIPALDRSRTIKSGSQAPRILLFARTGFTQALIDASVGDDDRVELIDAGMLAANLLEGD